MEQFPSTSLSDNQELRLVQHRLVSAAMPSGWGSMMFSLSTEPPFDGVLSVSEMLGAPGMAGDAAQTGREMVGYAMWTGGCWTTLLGKSNRGSASPSPDLDAQPIQQLPPQLETCLKHSSSAGNLYISEGPRGFKEGISNHIFKHDQPLLNG